MFRLLSIASRLVALALLVSCAPVRTPRAGPSTAPRQGSTGSLAAPEAQDPAPTEDPGETELDYGALEALIARKLRDEEIPASEPTGTGHELLSMDRLAGDVPPAAETANLSSKACLSALMKRGVEIEVPDFETPHVDTPLLLAGPLEGVSIEPRWPKANRTQEVLDCRLALSLVGLARIAGNLGVRRILYYSIYRPSPGDKPPKKGSQHQRGLAIDIGWLELGTGELVSVLDSFPRADGRPPCDEADADAEGELLQRFACQAHADKLFQVMLTPNANKEHHNHFHFDLTPDSDWYILE